LSFEVKRGKKLGHRDIEGFLFVFVFIKAGGRAQVVKPLSSKHEVLSSNSDTTKKIKKSKSEPRDCKIDIVLYVGRVV
jgi:hypothetical protein